MGSLQHATCIIPHTYCMLFDHGGDHTYLRPLAYVLFHCPHLSLEHLGFELGGFGACMKCRTSHDSSSAVVLVGTRQGNLLTDERKLLIGEAFGFLASFTISGLALG